MAGPAQVGATGQGGHAPDQAVQRQGAGAGGQWGGLAEVQAQRLLGLQAADQAVADGQPVQAGDEQLAGQQATLVHQRLVRLTRGALVAACGEGTEGTVGTYCPLGRHRPRDRQAPGCLPGGRGLGTRGHRLETCRPAPRDKHTAAAQRAPVLGAGARAGATRGVGGDRART